VIPLFERIANSPANPRSTSPSAKKTESNEWYEAVRHKASYLLMTPECRVVLVKPLRRSTQFCFSFCCVVFLFLNLIRKLGGEVGNFLIEGGEGEGEGESSITYNPIQNSKDIVP
jgi:hypothetical protein